MKQIVYSAVFALLGVAALSAQETSHFAFQAGAGFVQGVGRTGNYLDTGWNTSLGVGFNFNSYVGALVDLNADNLGINSATLNTIGVPQGSLTVFSATLDPIVHLMPHHHVDVYLTGGGGEYRRSQTFVQPLSSVTFGVAPYFGFTVPGDRIVFSSSVNKPGVDAGIGFAVGTKWHGKIYAEAKYDRIFLGGPYHTDYLPVTFGYRW